MTTPSKVDTLAGPSSRREERKVLAGTLVGTTIEWYDFFIFAQLTATLLSPLFLAPLNESNPGLAQILSFALIGISFLFRPLGAVIAGDLGDRLGRKAMLVFTLVMMGAATALIDLMLATGGELVTVLAGSAVDENALNAVTEQMRRSYPGVELAVYETGQHDDLMQVGIE